jgi:hypothetical protein
MARRPGQPQDGIVPAHLVNGCGRQQHRSRALNHGPARRQPRPARRLPRPGATRPKAPLAGGSRCARALGRAWHRPNDIPHLQGGLPFASPRRSLEAGAISELQGIARFKFDEGKLEEFKRLSAPCMQIVRTKDTGTLQYESYVNDDQSRCIVLERYKDPRRSYRTRKRRGSHAGDPGHGLRLRRTPR